MNCSICDCKSTEIFTGQMLNKYSCRYYKCNRCGFVQTESPYWLDEAYSNAIADLDIGLIGRNMLFSKYLERILLENFDYRHSFVDFAGGYGLLTRMMRDRGFDFYWQDKYCTNIFAKGFEINTNISKGPFELLTAFEVFEHLINPMEELDMMLNYSSNILFSTELVPSRSIKSQEDWWYFVPETGQHIAFYTLETLHIMARKYNLYLYSNGSNLHLFTKKKMKRNPFNVPVFSLRYRIVPFLERLVDRLYKKRKGIVLLNKIEQDFDFTKKAKNKEN